MDYDKFLYKNQLYKDYLKIVEAAKFDYVVGSVHGKYDSLEEYLNATLDLVSNYPISVLGHFNISTETINWNKLNDILLTMKRKNILFENNLAARYNKSFYEKNKVIEKVNTANVPIIYGSDSHSLEEFKLYWSKIN